MAKGKYNEVINGEREEREKGEREEDELEGERERGGRGIERK